MGGGGVAKDTNFPKTKIRSQDRFVKDIVERKLHPDVLEGERFCFILGAGASVESGIPAGTKLEMRWMNWLMGVEEDPLADENETPRRSREDLEEDAADLLEDKLIEHSFSEIEQEWQRAKDDGKPMSSEYYFDIYTLRFPQKKYAYRYLERLMESHKPSIGYHTLALLLTKNNQHNLVITTNFDRLLEIALSSYTDKIPQVVVHESMVDFLDAKLERPLIAKVHRDLLCKPLNEQSETDKLKEGWKQALGYILRHYTPIVIGYAGGDHSLMDFLLEEKDHLPGLYWCYREGDGLPEDERIRKLVQETEDAYFVGIEGFDALMVQIGWKLYGAEITPTGTQDFMNQKTEKDNERYNKSWNSLYDRLKKNNEFEKYPGLKEALGYLDKAEEKEEEKREAAGELTAEDYFRRGNRAYEEGDFPKVIEEYSKAIELDPDNAKIYVNRGNAYNETGRNREAIENYNKAIELDPDDAAAYNNRGAAYAADNKPNEAIADYSKAIELKPDYAEAYNNRGAAYNETGRNREAIADYSKAIELDPKDAEAYYNRGNAFKDSEQYEKAIADYSKAIDLKPDFALAYNNRAIAYAEEGKFDKAITDYSKAIELDPNDAVAYHNRALDYRAIGKIDLAKADEKRARILRNQKNKK